jgi:LPXTG-motif cell wall-anchored protein
MSEFNDNQFEEFEEEPQASPEPSRPGGNRNFILAIGILGAISLLTLIVLIVVGLVILPARNSARLQQAAVINAGNTATAQAATQLAFAQQQTLSVVPTETMTASASPVPSSTPVVAIATATVAPTAGLGTPLSQQDLSARTQTVAALLTQAAGGTRTPTQRSTALPTTGFADEVGLPALIGLAVLLIVVIFLVRRVRMTSGS